MDGRTLRVIEDTGPDLEVVKPNRPRVFQMAAATPDGGRASLTCTKTACTNTELKIRYGSVFVLRNRRCLITEQPLLVPLFCRHLLEETGLNTRKLFAAPSDRFAGFIDAGRLVGTFAEKGGGLVSRVIEGVFYADDRQHTEEEDDTREEPC